MKIGQKAIGRWMSKLVANGASHASRKLPAGSLRELDAEQLRFVSGGASNASQLPNKGW